MAQQHKTLYFLIKVEKSIDFHILHTMELFENMFVLHILDGMHNNSVVISQTVTPNTFSKKDTNKGYLLLKASR